ncbi:MULTISPECIES: hypothetical protein [Roseovarius]|jgi:hypothetical protein|uniref:hypothetical protein n=2 Tax=Roseovarius TaxID=74030 RepID=UPI00273F8BDF|nr:MULTISPECIES: hypothetical protein [unclassified Roseovarius]
MLETKPGDDLTLNDSIHIGPDRGFALAGDWMDSADRRRIEAGRALLGTAAFTGGFPCRRIRVMTQENSRQLRTRNGDWISPQELQEVLAEEGYSWSERMNFLNSVLTDLAAESAEHGAPDGKAAALLAEVRRILEEEQGKYGRRPIAEDLP